MKFFVFLFLFLSSCINQFDVVAKLSNDSYIKIYRTKSDMITECQNTKSHIIKVTEDQKFLQQKLDILDMECASVGTSYQEYEDSLFELQYGLNDCRLSKDFDEHRIARLINRLRDSENEFLKTVTYVKSQLEIFWQ